MPMNTFLAQNQFISNSAASRPPAVESSVVSDCPPARDTTDAPIRAPSQGAFAGSDIASDGRNIAGHAANQRSEPGKAGECGSIPQESTNSAGFVMLPAECEGVASSSPVNATPEPISRVIHNPVTHAVEVRPQVSPGACGASHNSGECEPSVMMASMPGESSSDGSTESRRAANTAGFGQRSAKAPEQQQTGTAPIHAPAAGLAPSPSDSIDCIGEIFVGARRLPQRELPPDFQARLLEAIESDEIWADEKPLFLRSPTE